jgi:hypothetical protein
MSESNLETSVQYIGTPQVMTQNVYVNSYYDVNYISVDSTTNISNELGQTVYPQGMNTIFINKFDNYVKFKIFTKSPDKKQNVSLDLASTGMNIKLAFILDDNTKTYIDPTQDMAAADPGAGEVMFRLDDQLTTKLLGGTQRSYYIVNKNEMGDEVLIYSGKFANDSERTTKMSEDTENIISNLQAQVTALQNAQQQTLTPVTPIAVAATTTPTTTVPTTTAPLSAAVESTSNNPIDTAESEIIAQTEQSLSVVEESSQGTKEAIVTASNTGKTESLNIVEIPGVTRIPGASIKSAISPKVIKPSKPSTKLTTQDVSSSELKKTIKKTKPKKK